MDRRLREALQRARASQSPAARDALFEALRRLADLTDRAQWSAAAPWAQDVVLEAIGRWLAPAFTLTGVEAYAVGGVAHRIGSFQHTATRITLHLIPGGWFVQGAANTRASEQPQRRVRIAPLLVARYPTLQVQWDHLGGSDDREWQGALLPIERVSWEEVQRWLTRAGDGLRLPSESEWEYACRAGTSSPYFWGEVMDPRYCWHAGGPWCGVD